MTQKTNFSAAYASLAFKDAKNVKEKLCRACKWSHQTFSQRIIGTRALQASNAYDKNEFAIVERVFKTYGLDAWTGKPIPVEEPVTS